MAQEDMMTSFTKAEANEEQIKIRDQFKSRFPVTKDNRRMMDQMTSTLVQHYAELEDWTKAKSYIDQIIDPMTKASVCNNYAWTLSGESIEAEAPHLDVAADLSSTSLSLLSTDNPPPTGLTKKNGQLQWKTIRPCMVIHTHSSFTNRASMMKPSTSNLLPSEIISLRILI